MAGARSSWDQSRVFQGALQKVRRRCRQGALEQLEACGLLTVETKHAGPETRYTFHVLKEPPILSSRLLAKLPKRLQQMHSDLLDRCGLEPETYQQISSTPYAQGTAKHYKESKMLEEMWREAKSALSREMTDSDFRT